MDGEPTIRQELPTQAGAAAGRTRADPGSGVGGPLPPGHMLGPWRLDSLIGAGAMGAVYRASQRDGTEAAIKILLKAADPGARKRFLRESRSLQRIDHPNVIRVLDQGEGETPWIALEFIEGEDLHAVAKRELPFSLARLAPFAVQVLRGLSAAHQAGVVHRDLKPANILVGKGGVIKIADFGLARRDEESLALTRAGQLMGTPYYMSPEQACGEEADAASDIYSFGAILFHLLSGKPVFSGALTEIIIGHMERPAPPLVAPGVPQRLIELVGASLSKNPADRPSIDALLAALSVHVAAQPAERVQRPKAKPAPKRKPTPKPKPKPRRPGRRESASDHQRVTSERQKRLSTSSEELLGHLNPYLPEGTTPEVRPAPEPPRAQPRVPFPRMRILDLFAGLVFVLTALVCADVWFQVPILNRIPIPKPVYEFLVPPKFFAVIAVVGVIVCERLFCVVDRVLLARKARTLETTGQAVAAAGLLEALGRREQAGKLLLKSGRYDTAASMFVRGGLGELAGEALERGGKTIEALRMYRSVESMENAFRVALSDSSEEAIAYLVRYGQVDDVVEVYRKAEKFFLAADLLESVGRFDDALRLLEHRYERGDGYDYWQHLGKRGPQEKARWTLAKRIAWLHQKQGRQAKAAKYWEAGKKYDRACDLYAQIGWRDEELNTCEAGLRSESSQTRERMRRRMAELATLFEAEKDPRAAKVLGLLGRTVAAAKLAERLGNDALAMDFYLEADRPAEAAECAVRAGELATAARLFMELGEDARAAPILEELGHLEQAANAYGRIGDQVKAAELMGRSGDPLGAARALIELERFEEAERLLDQIPAESGERYHADQLRAGLLRRRGKLQEALELYQVVLGDQIEFEEELDSHLSRVACARELGRFEEALAWLEQLRGKPYAPANLAQSIAAVRSELERQAPPAPVADRSTPSGTGAVLHAHALVGQTLDRYAVTGLIGEGSFAWVYRAQHTSLGRPVALKVLKPTICTGDVSVRFLREGQALAGLEHPNLIKVYDAGEAEGLSYLVLELVEGASLRERLTQAGGSLPLPAALKIGSGVLAGLECAHRAGIVHRDLKPTNVLLGPGDVVKLVDFGIARLLDDTARTMTKEFLGTPRYASPEQARGEPVEAAADQYAAALIIYEMLTGRLPFESSTTLGWLGQHMNAAPLPLNELRPKLPRELVGSVMRALDKAPARRHPSVEAFRRALRPPKPRR